MIVQAKDGDVVVADRGALRRETWKSERVLCTQAREILLSYPSPDHKDATWGTNDIRMLLCSPGHAVGTLSLQQERTGRSSLSICLLDQKHKHILTGELNQNNVSPYNDVLTSAGSKFSRREVGVSVLFLEVCHYHEPAISGGASHGPREFAGKPG